MNKASLSSRGLIGFVPSSIGILLALLVMVAFPSSSVLADQCAEVEFHETGNCCIHNIYVSLSTATSGATIFVTSSTTYMPADPTHNGSTPTGTTSTWVGPNFVVPPGGRLDIKAIAYKAGSTDSAVTEYLVENY
ncbi:MAG TPA: hypothetical protein VJU77_07400 [Chthoniobacterales bacterium]|nr:hypothetical protein [Chthoniobacterales bacterium]